MTSSDRRTRHHVEFFVDGSGVGYRLKCSDRLTCTDTRDEDRTGDFCAVEDWWENVGTDLLSAPRSTVIAAFEVVTEWRGYGEDADLFVVPKAAL